MRSLTLGLTMASTIFTSLAAAQQSAPTPVAREEDLQEIVIVGSNIRRAEITGILPVTVIEADDIDATVARSGDDLMRSIPQAGDVAFNEGRDAGGINDARGDTASINLRALGTGNTLILLNGRRMVLHPGTQSENLVPVQSVNTNTIPVTGVRRIEVLRDGAAAIYGTDAVAGVINTVLKSNFDGLTVQAEYGDTAESGQREYELSFEAGQNFNNKRTNVSLFGSFNNRTPLFAIERDRAGSADLRRWVQGTPFAGDSDFDNRSNDTIWAEFQRLNPNFSNSTTAVRLANGTTLTTNGIFHVQPGTNPGCLTPVTNGVCYDNSSLSTASEDNNLRYDTAYTRTLSGENERINLFGFFNHETESGIELFGELGYYHADFRSQREQDTPLANQRLIAPANAFWNPLGPATSPNRIAGVTGIPVEGVPLEIIDYRPVDIGPQQVRVRNETTRALVGARGAWRGFDWESAAWHSRARTNDTMGSVSMTRFQQAISRTDNTAYNPFSGGDPLNPGILDSTPNPESIARGLLVDISRISEMQLKMVDFKISRPDIFALPAGNVGLAAGLEYRDESFRDDRDARLDGTIAFVALDGSSNGSDVMGVSPTPDTSGSRSVFAGYAELALPLVSPSMDIPLVHRVSAQLAGRYESYTFFGDVTKPKLALSWEPIEWLQIRAAFSQGFRAPNLPQLFERGIQRSNTRSDWIRCEADRRAGRIANFDQCARSQGVVSNRSGSLELEPEESDNFTVGMTLQPELPQGYGGLTITADYWEIDQERVIGLFGDSNALTLDYFLRLSGSSNPNVQRAAPTAQELADFAGSGLTPVGRVIQVIDNYTNLTPRKVRGFDVALYYEIKNTPIGSFDLKLNGARLLEFFQTPDAIKGELLAAQRAGRISPAIAISGADSLVRQDGRPEWRISTTLTWRLGAFGAGYYNAYVGDVEDTGATLADGTTWLVDDHLTHNAYLQYTVDSRGPFDGLRMRLGARNLTNKDAPLADNPFGYIGDLYGNRGRYTYLSLRKRF